MQFEDSETQKLLRDTTGSYLAANYPPDRLYAIESGKTPLDRNDLDSLAGMGWLSLLAPEASGGGGVSLLEAATVIDEFGYAAVPAPVVASNVAAYVLRSEER